MNILILTTHLNPGGISRYVLNLSKGLKQRGHHVAVASQGGEWVDKLLENGITHKYIPIKTKSIISVKIAVCFFILLPFMFKNKFAVIHGNTRVTNCLSFLLSKCFARPYIASFHGYYRSGFFRKRIKLAGSKSIAVSQAVKQHLTRNLVIPAEKIEVVYNGIDKDDFCRRKMKKSDANFRENDFILGILGRISEEKGHFLAVQAVKNLCAKYEDIFLLISGAGKLRQKLEEFIAGERLTAKVKFLNWNPEEFLDILDLLIMPSKKEGFGYAIIEAFAKDVPVIGFNVGGIAELIKHNETGLLFYNYDSVSLQNAIETLLLDKEKRKSFAANAKKTLPLFSLEKMAEETERVYKNISGNKNLSKK